jgi:hypothetical protein
MAVDSMRNQGIDRDKMIISDGLDSEPRVYLKSESDDLAGYSFAPPGKITMAVEVPQPNVAHIAAILKQSGAASVQNE